MLSIDRETINTAEKLIRPHIRKTPIIEMRGSEIGIDSVELVLKLELFQHSGSFKPRGAFTNMLMREVPSTGVVAASGGNHGAAVAYAAMKLNKPAKIFVPTVASPAKMNRIKSYGADLVVTGERYAESLLASEDWVNKTGALPIHAYDQPETLVGQGTVATEFHDQDPTIDTLLVAVGGGGLIGGIAAWYAGNVKIIGVEPELAPTLAHAMRAGHPVDAPAGGVAADSLAPKRVGEIMFPIARKYVSMVALVSDDAIVQAQKFLWDRLRIVAEPGGAAALSALLSKQYVPKKGERIGVVVCGGNTEAVRFE